MRRDRRPRLREDDAPSAVAAVLDPDAHDGEVMATAARVIAEARQEEARAGRLGRAAP